MDHPVTVTLRRLDSGQEFVFAERTTRVLGRAADCSPRLPNDEHHRTVSRHHCLLDINPPAVRIRDFGSLNGTYVNGEKIGQRAPGQSPADAAALSFPERDLADGDEIRLGRTVLRVEIRGRSTESLSESLSQSLSPDEPEIAAELLLRLARSGRRDLAPVAGYVRLRELGRGGMGAVYLARHETTGQEVALKVMLPRVAASATARTRFLREIVVTRSLRHPNIATLHDAGFADGTFYFTTEYCDGGNLADHLTRRGGRLAPADAVRLAVQALEGLEHAHTKGVVHRDLSPHNLLLHDGTLKVADFGLAKAFDQAGLSGLTRTGATAGKPYYLPRQQVVNFRDATPAVDVWALAACLYRTLTGTHPRDFPPGRDPWQIILQTDAVPLRRRAPGVPQPLAEVVDEALREPSSLPTATALREALLGYSASS
ncbi:protein kinase [Dactylosporangium sp. AC04546]|uniref:protein kinase domain-containing protein n=1 Tax=Dactylosporangium sp. AC04546 TaxID=2862460 RepID=UPI001EDFAF5A|nr:protein kinase [Dactylosporangium sp. AC04546]WVK88427.1 protein kinase [Dactylosporangium sp. AC04546]